MTLRYDLPLSLLLLSACSGGDAPKEAPATTDAEPADRAASCGITVTAYPALGAADHYYRDPIEFHLSGPDRTATVSGLAGTTSISADGETITFTPDALEPSTSYQLVLDWCGGTLAYYFTTSDLGSTPVDFDIVGDTYRVELADARFTSPPGLGSIFSSQCGPLLLGVVEGEGTLEILGAPGGEWRDRQDTCAPTAAFPAVPFTPPGFAIGPQDVMVWMADGWLPIYDLAITGTFAPDGYYFGGGTLSGRLDARDIAAALPDLGYDPQGLCDLMVSFGAACTACDDGENLCLDIAADRITADKVSGTLVEVTAADCPGCDTGEPVCE